MAKRAEAERQKLAEREERWQRAARKLSRYPRIFPQLQSHWPICLHTGCTNRIGSRISCAILVCIAGITSNWTAPFRRNRSAFASGVRKSSCLGMVSGDSAGLLLLSGHSRHQPNSDGLRLCQPRAIRRVCQGAGPRRELEDVRSAVPRRGSGSGRQQSRLLPPTAAENAVHPASPKCR
jgi:hypothetical protein